MLVKIIPNLVNGFSQQQNGNNRKNQILHLKLL